MKLFKDNHNGGKKKLKRGSAYIYQLQNATLQLMMLLFKTSQ